MNILKKCAFILSNDAVFVMLTGVSTDSTCYFLSVFVQFRLKDLVVVELLRCFVIKLYYH